MEKPSEVPDNLKARLKNLYDAIAEKYTAWPTKTSDIRVSYLERLLSLLSAEHKDILEIGCGAGIPTTEKSWPTTPPPVSRPTTCRPRRLPWARRGCTRWPMAATV